MHFKATTLDVSIGAVESDVHEKRFIVLIIPKALGVPLFWDTHKTTSQCNVDLSYAAVYNETSK